LLSGCTTDKNSNKDFVYGEPTTIAAAPLIIAGEKGFWQDEGLNVRTERFSAGRLALDATISGNAQANSVSETGPVLAILNGQEIFVVATAGQHKETKFIGRKDKGIFVPQDLKGKKIATLPGTNSDYFMYVFLETNGISTNDLTILQMQPPEMINALIKGDIDGFFAWEPHIYYAQQTLKGNSTIFEADGLYSGYHTVIMRQDFVQDNPEKVEKFLRGILKAEKFIEKNREESIRIVANHLGMKEADANKLFGEYTFSLKLDKGLFEVMNKEAKWAIDGKVVVSPKNQDLHNYIFTDILKKVDSNSVSI